MGVQGQIRIYGRNQKTQGTFGSKGLLTSKGDRLQRNLRTHSKVQLDPNPISTRCSKESRHTSNGCKIGVLEREPKRRNLHGSTERIHQEWQRRQSLSPAPFAIRPQAVGKELVQKDR